jgi:hypothetical protein
MTDIVEPGSRILFMKVGTHAEEPLSSIIERKRKEIEQAGFSLWGYGGNTCHPVTMVQPFVAAAHQQGQPIYLCMEPMVSNHFAITERASEYSSDGLSWKEVPDAINVIGSRYALAITDLHEQELELPLEETKVAIGNQMGRQGDRYIKGRVDKACLEVVDPGSVEHQPGARVAKIGLVAELVEPYAVYVRNT